MTKSTGKRAQQQRREELLSADFKLSGVIRYLMNAVAFGKMRAAELIVHDSTQALFVAIDALTSVRREVGELN